MSEKRRDVFARLQWVAATPGACPHCFSPNHYLIETRGNLKCADCGRQFSPYWHSPFFRHKLPIGNLLSIAKMIIVEKKSLLQISKLANVDYKTVWYFNKRLQIYIDMIKADLTEGERG